MAPSATPVTIPSVPSAPARRASSAALAWRRFVRNKPAVIALGFILLQILIAVFAPCISPYDPYVCDDTATYGNPSSKHLLGADDLGRDVLSRIIYGTRISYAVGVLSQVAIVLIGLPLGAIAGLV